MWMDRGGWATTLLLLKGHAIEGGAFMSPIKLYRIHS